MLSQPNLLTNRILEALNRLEHVADTAVMNAKDKDELKAALKALITALRDCMVETRDMLVEHNEILDAINGLNRRITAAAEIRKEAKAGGLLSSPQQAGSERTFMAEGKDDDNVTQLPQGKGGKQPIDKVFEERAKEKQKLIDAKTKEVAAAFDAFKKLLNELKGLQGEQEGMDAEKALMKQLLG